MLLVPGMVFTIEPMINLGTDEIFIDSDNDWTVYTEDGAPSAQWEVYGCGNRRWILKFWHIN
mgnify:CR=1 FL=1